LTHCVDIAPLAFLRDGTTTKGQGTPNGISHRAPGAEVVRLSSPRVRFPDYQLSSLVCGAFSTWTQTILVVRLAIASAAMCRSFVYPTTLRIRIQRCMQNGP